MAVRAELWSADPTDQALAVSTEGATLYMVDRTRRSMARMDTVP